MIDRTTFDLRITEHATNVARVNSGMWRQEGEAGHPLRATVARALVALAARLDAAVPPARQRDTTLAPANPA